MRPMHAELVIEAHLEDIPAIAELAASLARRREAREKTFLTPREATPVPEELKCNELKTFDDVQEGKEYMSVIERHKDGKGYFTDLGIEETVTMPNESKRRINGLIPDSNMPPGVVLKRGDMVLVRVLQKHGFVNKAIILSFIRKSDN